MKKMTIMLYRPLSAAVVRGSVTYGRCDYPVSEAELAQLLPEERRAAIRHSPEGADGLTGGVALEVEVAEGEIRWEVVLDALRREVADDTARRERLVQAFLEKPSLAFLEKPSYYPGDAVADDSRVKAVVDRLQAERVAEHEAKVARARAADARREEIRAELRAWAAGRDTLRRAAEEGYEVANACAQEVAEALAGGRGSVFVEGSPEYAECSWQTRAAPDAAAFSVLDRELRLAKTVRSPACLRVEFEKISRFRLGAGVPRTVVIARLCGEAVELGVVQQRVVVFDADGRCASTLHGATPGARFRCTAREGHVGEHRDGKVSWA